MTPDINTATNSSIMLWIMHKFSVVFKDHAILKGGMQLMLLSSHRATNDLDYVFSPFKSKKDVEMDIESILGELDGAKIEKTMHSKTGRFIISFGKANVQIEFNVSLQTKSEALSTQQLANTVGALPKVIRVMASDVALSHKLAAWNERRLLRDLYDVHFWHSIIGATPDIETLDQRLSSINSRLPKLKSKKKMSLVELCDELERALANLDESTFLNQLEPLIPKEHIDGHFPIFKASIKSFIDKLRITENKQ